MRNDPSLKIFSGTASRGFAEKICAHLDVTPGLCNTIVFSEGNTYVKIGEKVRGMDVYIVQTIGLDPNNEFMELLFWVDAFKRASVNSVTAIIPYFSYAKADKKDEPRVSIRARVCADALEAAGVDRVVTMDLHSPQIQGFFRKPVDHLYASIYFIPHIRSLGLADFVIVSPDEGFAKNARNYAHGLDVSLAIGTKQRSDHSERAEVLSIIGHVKGKDAVLVDDFTISCGTLIDAARLLKRKGAEKVYAYVSHALLTEKALIALEKSHITRLYTTDTVDNPVLHKSEKIEVLSVARLFADSIRIIHNNESLGDMFP